MNTTAERRKAMTPQQIEQFHLRKLCIHESGHACIAQHFGAPVQIEIWKRPPNSETAFGARTGLHEVLKPRLHHCIVSLAGEVAELFAIDASVNAMEIAEHWQNNIKTISDEDKVGAGKFSIADIEKTLALVRQLWPTIMRCAEEAITKMNAELKPRRVQQRRGVKGWRMPANTVSVARPHKWGNPFKVGIDGDVDDCVAMYIINGCEHDVSELRGKNLACFCKLNAPCHADVLLELANK